MGSPVILNIENDDKFCFLCSILAHLHPFTDFERGHPTRLSSYTKFFDEINHQVFDFTNGCKCSDILEFEKQNNLFKRYLNFVYIKLRVNRNIN